jgi:hypothetical protein
MTRPLASYLEPWIADGDPLPSTITVNAADLLAAVGELERVQKLVDLWRSEGEKRHDAQGPAYTLLSTLAGCAEALAAALAPADG